MDLAAHLTLGLGVEEETTVRQGETRRVLDKGLALAEGQEGQGAGQGTEGEGLEGKRKDSVGNFLFLPLKIFCSILPHEPKQSTDSKPKVHRNSI
jgi:hypothetical protein